MNTILFRWCLSIRVIRFSQDESNIVAPCEFCKQVQPWNSLRSHQVFFQIFFQNWPVHMKTLLSRISAELQQYTQPKVKVMYVYVLVSISGVFWEMFSLLFRQKWTTKTKIWIFVRSFFIENYELLPCEYCDELKLISEIENHQVLLTI